jgi:hypothetical protein
MHEYFEQSRACQFGGSYKRIAYDFSIRKMAGAPDVDNTMTTDLCRTAYV